MSTNRLRPGMRVRTYTLAELDLRAWNIDTYNSFVCLMGTNYMLHKSCLGQTFRLTTDRGDGRWNTEENVILHTALIKGIVAVSPDTNEDREEELPTGSPIEEVVEAERERLDTRTPKRRMSDEELKEFLIEAYGFDPVNRQGEREHPLYPSIDKRRYEDA